MCGQFSSDMEICVNLPRERRVYCMYTIYVSKDTHNMEKHNLSQQSFGCFFNPTGAPIVVFSY